MDDEETIRLPALQDVFYGDGSVAIVQLMEPRAIGFVLMRERGVPGTIADMTNGTIILAALRFADVAAIDRVIGQLEELKEDMSALA